MASLFLLLLCVMTSQAAQSKDTVVTDLVVKTTTSAVNKIDDSESFTCAHILNTSSSYLSVGESPLLYIQNISKGNFWRITFCSLNSPKFYPSNISPPTVFVFTPIRRE